MEKIFNGKTVLITGLGRKGGIGMALAKTFAERGANVFFSYFYADGEKEEFEKILEDLKIFGTEIGGMHIDLSSPDSAKRLFSEAIKKFGKIDVLINNAANSERDSLENLSASIRLRR